MLEITADAPRDLNTPTGLASQVVDQRGEKVLIDPFANEFVACSQADHPIGHAVVLHAREPLLEARRRLRPRECDSFVPEGLVLHLDPFHSAHKFSRGLWMPALHRCTKTPSAPG